MTDRILGVGPGAFVVGVLWIGTIILVIIFSRAKRPFSFFGFVFIAASTIATLILVFTPRGPETSDSFLDFLPPDYLFTWKCVLILFMGLGFIISVVLMVFEMFAISMIPEPLVAAPHRTVSSNSLF